MQIPCAQRSNLYPGPMMRILFVCLGNICRSPSAEAVLRAKAQAANLGLDIDSAGTGGWHIGDPPYGPMIKAGAARGYDLSRLRARKVRERDFLDFDLIVGMDADNVSDLEALRPRDNQTPVRLMTSFFDGGPDAVPDPYYSGDFEGALDLIEHTSDGLLHALAADQLRQND